MEKPQSLKILMLISQFYPAIGGAERECQNLSRKLAALGHRVSVLTTYADGLQPRDIVDGIPVYRKIRGWHLFELTYMLSVLLLLWRMRKSFDTVICFGLYLYTPAAVLFGRCFGKKIFFRLECSGASGDFARIAQLKTGRFIIGCSRWAHGMLAISGEIERELLGNGFARSKVVRVPNSVDTQRFSPLPDAEKSAIPHIVCIGRLDRQKGIDLLLRALQQLRDDSIAFTACIVGGGPMRQNLIDMAESLALSDAVTFAGPQEDTAPWYRRADILAMPSRDEGLPLALLEAMASGLGIIAAAVGGVPEVLDPGGAARSRSGPYAVCEAGILVEPENPSQLAAGLRALATDAGLRRRLGAAARSRSEKMYCLGHVAEIYLKLIRDC